MTTKSNRATFFQPANQKGFTIVEVLIASLIMFMALSSASLIFKNARENSDKALATVAALSPLPLLLETIQYEIQNNLSEEVQGEGVLQGISFEWQARQIEYVSPPVRFNVENASVTEFLPRYKVYQVELLLSYRGRRYPLSYQELAWNPSNQEIGK